MWVSWLWVITEHIRAPPASLDLINYDRKIFYVDLTVFVSWHRTDCRWQTYAFIFFIFFIPCIIGNFFSTPNLQNALTLSPVDRPHSVPKYSPSKVRVWNKVLCVTENINRLIYFVIPGNILNCAVGKGRRRMVGLVVWEMKKCYIERRRRGISHVLQKEGRLTALVTSYIRTAF